MNTKLVGGGEALVVELLKKITFLVIILDVVSACVSVHVTPATNRSD